jgi:hypothetical protein
MLSVVSSLTAMKASYPPAPKLLVYPTITFFVSHIATARATSVPLPPKVICLANVNACTLVCSLNAPKAKITAIIIEATIIPWHHLL